MKIIQVFLVLVLIVFSFGCHFASKKIRETSKTYTKNKKEVFSYYLDSKGEQVKHGLYSFIHSNEKDKIIFSERYVFYKEGNKEGMEVVKGQYQTIIAFYNQGIVTDVSFFNNKGEKRTSCSMKNGKPYNGKIWSLALGARGIKWNKITTYKDGKCLKEEDCNLYGQIKSP